QDVWPGEACLASSGAMLATTPKEMREAMGGRSAVLTTQTSSFFIASADPAQRSWLNGSVLKRELSDGYARLRPAMGLPDQRLNAGPETLAEMRTGVVVQTAGQLRRPDVCPAPSPLGISYKADAEAIRDSRKLVDCPPGFGSGHFDPASLIRTTPDGSNRGLYAASLLPAQEKRQSFGSPAAFAAPIVEATPFYGAAPGGAFGPGPTPGATPAPSLGAINTMMGNQAPSDGASYSDAFRQNANANQQYNGGGTMTVQHTYTDQTGSGGSGGGQPPGGPSGGGHPFCDRPPDPRHPQTDQRDAWWTPPSAPPAGGGGPPDDGGGPGGNGPGGGGGGPGNPFGGGGQPVGGANDPLLQQLTAAFTRMADLQERQLTLTSEQRRAERDRQLKIEHRLVKVGHDGKGQVPMQLLKFERQMQEFNIPTWKEWVNYLTQALCEECRNLLEAKQTRRPFLDIVSRARQPNSSEWDWLDFYGHSRFEILVWCDADLFKPADEAEKMWRAIHFEEASCNKSNYLEEKLQLLETARSWMVITEAFKENQESVDREMKWLEEKIPKGTPLYFEIYRSVRPANFDQWSQLIRNYKSMLPQPVRKAVPAIVKANLGNIQFNDGVKTPAGGQQPKVVEINTYQPRMSDSRAADGGFQGGARKAPGGGPPQASAEALRHVPKCEICKGRHLAGPKNRCKPNEIAKARRAERHGGVRLCDYNTRTPDGSCVECRGQGHERADHIKFMQELGVRRVAASRAKNNLFERRKKGHGKGKSKGKSKGKGKSSRGRPGQKKTYYKKTLRRRFIPKASPGKLVYRTGTYTRKKVVRTRRTKLDHEEVAPDEEYDGELEDFGEYDLEKAPEATGAIDPIDEEIIWDGDDWEEDDGYGEWTCDEDQDAQDHLYLPHEWDEGEEEFEDDEEGTQWEDWEQGARYEAPQASESQQSSERTEGTSGFPYVVRGSRGTVTFADAQENWPGDDQGFSEATYATSWYGSDGGSVGLKRGS
ncbi:MAG: hypothetical protein ACR2M9_03350, partial [Cyanophyceae cyanobacterium]